MKFIDKYKSPNFDKRKKGSTVNFIIIHYTALKDDNEALQYLCDKKNKVSSHFLVNKHGTIFKLVDLKYRAWHAGNSYWKGFKDLNSNSIGIELDNLGYDNDFINYNALQIKSLIRLISYISKKFSINPENILGHSDIAPYRKIDPGSKFPWKQINNKNLSFLPKKISKNISYKLEKKCRLIQLKGKKRKTLYMLKKIGYNVSPSKNNNKKYRILIKAYQMHFRQKITSGKLDSETYKLIQSHYNQILT